MGFASPRLRREFSGNHPLTECDQLLSRTGTGRALRATREAGGGAWLCPRPAGRGRISVQARIRPWPRLRDALHRRHPIRKPASRDRKVPRKRVDTSLSAQASNLLGTFQDFLSRRTAGFPIRRGEECPVRGWSEALAAGGELVPRPPAEPRPKPSKTAPRPAGFLGRA